MMFDSPNTPLLYTLSYVWQNHHYCILFHMYGKTQSFFSQVSNLLPRPPLEYLTNKKLTLNILKLQKKTKHTEITSLKSRFHGN